MQRRTRANCCCKRGRLLGRAFLTRSKTTKLKGCSSFGPASCLSRESSRQPLKSRVEQPGIRWRRGVHLGEVDAARPRHDLAEYIIAANDHDLIDAGRLGGAVRLLEPRLEAVRHHSAIRHKGSGLA